MKNYSLINHSVESLHDIIPDILPGIEKIITIHKVNSNELKGILSEKKGSSYVTKDLELLNMSSVLNRFMEDKNPFDWYSRTNLPFEIDHLKKNPIIDIFSELHNVVLLIRLPQLNQDKNALVFIYLNENPSNFGVTNSINPLTTDNKSIIAFILRNTILTVIRQQQLNKNIMTENNQRFRSIIRMAEAQKNEMRQTRESYGLSLIRLCHQFLIEYRSRSDKTFKFSSGALDKIKNYKGELKDLRNKIQETLAFAELLYLDENGEIEISDWHLQFDGAESRFASEKRIEIRDDKYFKTLALLDKLETAALRVKSQHMKLTGTNVGRACQVPISAPAITDALYNHKTKINSLVKLYPEKWETIRSEFKPVLNIILDR